MNPTKIKKFPLYIGILILLLFILMRFGLYWLKTDGFSGLSVLLPAMLLCFIVFAFCTSAFFAAWVYQDCIRRNDDPLLWAFVIFIATPFIGLLVYFLRRSELKGSCPACGHNISLNANYCEECGASIQKEEPNIMVKQETHHLNFIAAGIVSMVIMLTCLTVFIGNAATGNGINTNTASSDRVWNLGTINMNYNTCTNDTWKLNFKNASDGFVKEQKMTIANADTQLLHADISCGTVPDGASLILWLVQNDIAESIDVTNLSEPLEYPLTQFEDGTIRVRLQINGVENTVSEIYMK